MGAHKGRSGRVYRRLVRIYRERCEREQARCVWMACPDPEIDYSLRKPHPRAFSVDHIIPVSKLAPNDRLLESLSNFQPMHQACNSSKGNGDRTPKPKNEPHQGVTSMRLM